MKHWYALHTKPNAEFQVKTALQRRDLEVYLPEIEEPSLLPKGKSKPLFPCYLFLRVDFEVIGLSRVQWTPGLRRVLTFGDQPLPVSNQVIDLIRCKLGEIEAERHRLGQMFKPGDTVRITEGPLKDMLAIFERPTTASQRVQVLLKILGASRVQVDVADLEQAPLDAEAPRPKRLRRTRGRGRHIQQTARQA